MIPTDYRDLVDRPIVCDLATVRPDGSVQLNPMWFLFDGEHVRFSHTSNRQKYRNLMGDSRMTALIVDPEDPQRYMELRGALHEVTPDPTGRFHQVLASRYGEVAPPPPPNAAERVVLVMRIDSVRTRGIAHAIDSRTRGTRSGR